MHKLKLTYFDFDGGRGEAIRLALIVGNISFEDDRVSREQWGAIKSAQPYQALPVLYVDGLPLAQTNAICKYVGLLTDLYPRDPWQAALCDEVLETVEEINQKIGATMSQEGEVKKLSRQNLANEVLPVFLKGLESRLVASGGNFFSQQRLSVVDLRAFDLVRWLNSGILDDIPADLVKKIAPNLAAHADRIATEPRIKSYYNARTAKEF